MPMFDPRFPAFEVDAGGCNHYTDEDPWNGHKPVVFALMNYLRPKTVWELGTQGGNSFFSFCHAAALIGDVDPTYTDVQLHAVDTWRGDAHSGPYSGIHEKVRRYAQTHFPDNTHLWRMTFDEALAYCADGTVDLLHIDGLHTYEAVRHDFESWLPKLSRRGVVLFHDVVERRSDFGVYRLWAELTTHYASATLSHSHGLGILLVGPDVPGRLAALVATLDENTDEATQQLKRRSASALLAAEFPTDAGWQPAMTDGTCVHVAADNMSEEDRRITGELAACQQALEQACAEREQARAEVDALVQSRSWRITAPLRSIVRECAWFKQNYKPLIRRFLRQAWRTVPMPAGLRQRIGLALCRFAPGLMRGTSLDNLYRNPHRVSAGTGGAMPEPEAPAPTEWPAVGSQPLISVIIPVHNKWSLTAACLDSVRRYGACQPFEVVVVDDASSDETPGKLGACDDVVAVRNDDNLGFIGACNRGADAASGTYIVFLNNDTEVHAGWLDFLYQTFANVPDAGLVGAKLLYPNGRLQEAGGIVWENADGCNYGHNGDEGFPEYNYLRDVDYCSGACLMIERDFFLQLGGFDSYYAPAYYEDTDLAFRVREAGRRVLYQPLARITHFEGGSNGTDQGSGIKRYQAINRDRFHERWGQTLASHGTPEGDFHQNRQRTLRGRVLIIDLVAPAPDRDSGSVDAFNLMRILTGLSLQVSFIPGDNLMYAHRHTEAVQARGVECWYFPYLASVKDHLREYGSRYDVVILSRLESADKHMDTVRHYCPQAKVLFNTVDLHFLRDMRQAELEGSSSLKLMAERTKRRELAMVEAADLTLVISPAEQQLLEQERPRLPVAQLPLILNENTGPTMDFEQRSDLFFLGSFQHTPNVDAVRWFLTEVWPEVRRRLPAGVNVHIIGSHMPDGIKALTGEGVVIAGFVPDVDAYIAGMRLSIAPLRYGAGLKGKVARSLMHGIPCVASDIAAEGMAGQTSNGIVTASTPADYASWISGLYSDEQRWRNASDNACAYFKANYSYAAGTETVRSILKRLNVPALAGEKRTEAAL